MFKQSTPSKSLSRVLTPVLLKANDTFSLLMVRFVDELNTEKCINRHYGVESIKVLSSPKAPSESAVTDAEPETTEQPHTSGY